MTAVPEPKTKSRRAVINEIHRAAPAIAAETSPERLPGVVLPDLQREHCRFPLWGDAVLLTVDRTYCGDRAIGDMPYCASHCRIAYKPIDSRRG